MAPHSTPVADTHIAQALFTLPPPATCRSALSTTRLPAQTPAHPTSRTAAVSLRSSATTVELRCLPLALPPAPTMAATNRPQSTTPALRTPKCTRRCRCASSETSAFTAPLTPTLPMSSQTTRLPTPLDQKSPRHSMRPLLTSILMETSSSMTPLPSSLPMPSQAARLPTALDHRSQLHRLLSKRMPMEVELSPSTSRRTTASTVT